MNELLQAKLQLTRPIDTFNVNYSHSINQKIQIIQLLVLD